MAATVKIISWNVRGLNCPPKRGRVRWVLRRYSCDVTILLESKLEEVDRQVVLNLCGRHQSGFLFLLLVAQGHYYYS